MQLLLTPGSLSIFKLIKSCSAANWAFSKTFHENKKEEKTKELSEGKKSEVYNEITKAFSDAELLSVEEIDEWFFRYVV